MAFEGLTERLQNAIGKLRRKGKIGESGRREKYYSERLRPCGWGWIYCFRSSSFTCGQLWGSGV